LHQDLLLGIGFTNASILEKEPNLPQRKEIEKQQL
jgi:hypothetical protein